MAIVQAALVLSVFVLLGVHVFRQPSPLKELRKLSLELFAELVAAILLPLLLALVLIGLSMKGCL